MSSFSENGYVLIEWDAAEQDSEWVAWRVYRRITGSTTWTLLHETREDEPTYEYKDWTARSGVQYDYIVVQVALRFGAEVESPFTSPDTITPVSEDYWLIHKTDESKNVRLYVTQENFGKELEQETLGIIGRGRKKEFGTDWGYAGSLTCSIRRLGSGLTPSQQRALLEEILEEMDSFYLRNPFGDVWEVVTGSMPFTRIPGVGIEEMMDLTIEYQEIF